MSKQLGKKTLCINIPANLYNFYAKLCVDLEITKTDGIIKYFEYLKKRGLKDKQVLDSNIKSDFRLDFCKDDEQCLS